MANVQTIDNVVIRFAGDSGDGMQLTGTQFTNTSAIQGNDLATFPDFPAEIRAPAGTVAGVSGFQLHFSSRDIRTPGDAPNGASVPPAIATGIGLVAMTPVNWVMVFGVVMNRCVMVAMRLSWRGQAQCGQGDHRC